MSLESIEKITNVETASRERKAAAEAEAKQMLSQAEREGLGLLKQMRETAAENGKSLLQEAEARAAERSEKILRTAEADGKALREAAEKQLEQTAEFIVGRVVNH